MKYKVGDSPTLISYDKYSKLSCRFPTGSLAEMQVLQCLGRKCKIVEARQDIQCYKIDICKNIYFGEDFFMEVTMDAKTEALEAVRRAEEGLAKAKKLLEQVEKDPRIGKINKVWDDDEDPRDEFCQLAIVREITEVGRYPVKTNRCSWQHARLLTEEEKAKYL